MEDEIGIAPHISSPTDHVPVQGAVPGAQSVLPSHQPAEACYNATAASEPMN
jgi:hypothetical protein